MSNFIIRRRERRCASPKEGLRQVWEEVQIVDGRKILFRCDTEEQAARWIGESFPTESATKAA